MPLPSGTRTWDEWEAQGFPRKETMPKETKDTPTDDTPEQDDGRCEICGRDCRDVQGRRKPRCRDAYNAE